MSDGLNHIPWHFQTPEWIADYGVIALGAEGEIVQANPRALDELRRGGRLTMVEGRLCAVKPEVQAHLKRLVTLSSLTKLMQMGQARPRPQAEIARPAQLKLLTAPCGPGGHRRDAAAKMIVVIGNLEQEYVQLEKVMLQVQAGLTWGNHQFLMAVSRGMSIKEYAWMHEVSIHTARAHLRDIWHGIHRWLGPAMTRSADDRRSIIADWVYLMTAARFDIHDGASPDGGPDIPIQDQAQIFQFDRLSRAH